MKAYSTHPEVFDWSLAKRGLILAIIFVAICTLFGCRTTRKTIMPAKDIERDTVYFSNVKYDSIYVYRELINDRIQDTVYRKDVSVEYRYRLLRDTVRIVRLDSIPYEVTIVKTKEVVKPLSWLDYLYRLCFWILLAAIVVKIFMLRHKL